MRSQGTGLPLIKSTSAYLIESPGQQIRLNKEVALRGCFVGSEYAGGRAGVLDLRVAPRTKVGALGHPIGCLPPLSPAQVNFFGGMTVE